jgi:hypothetical protein
MATGTCPVCAATAPWETSTLSRHPAPEGADPEDRAAVLRMVTRGDKRPVRFDADRWACAGSYKPPVEAQQAARRMNAAERDLSRRVFGEGL